jgi:ribosomal-protein-serine acetyltransferase
MFAPIAPAQERIRDRLLDSDTRRREDGPMELIGAKPEPWYAPVPPPAYLETPRLIIRFYQDTDAPALFRAVDESRASLLPWLPWAASQHLSVESSLECVRRFGQAREEYTAPENNAVFGFIMGVFEKVSGELVGGTGFNRIDFETADAETGYWVVARQRGKGIATEATSAALSWGFTPQAEGGWEFRRIRIVAAAANGASCAVPHKLGLREECRFVKHRWVPGMGWQDTVSWGVLAEEWDCERSVVRRLPLRG